MVLTAIASYRDIPESRYEESVPKQCTPFRINEVCRALNHFGIFTKTELYDRFPEILNRITQNPDVFKNNYELSLCYKIFRQGVRAYEKAKETRIALGRRESEYFSTLIEEFRNDLPGDPGQHLADNRPRDLDRIVKNYERFESSLKSLEKTHEKLSALITAVDYVSVPHVILGLGDAGTTLWLEKYGRYHQTAKQQIDRQMIPDVIMIGQHVGSFKNSYALPQTHNSLERGAGEYHPGDFISSGSYNENQCVDGRHVYQSNILNLGKTGAPVLGQTHVIHVEKRTNCLENWHLEDQKYRLRVQIGGDQEKLIYTNELDVCTGLGHPKNGYIQKFVGSDEFKRLSQIDKKTGYPALIAGDRYILGFQEGASKMGKRTILILGGGDTAVAAYRKAFFGKDFCVKEYSEKERKNDVLWFSSHGFSRIGKGKMPNSALDHARETGALFDADLKHIEFDADTKKLNVFVSPKQPPAGERAGRSSDITQEDDDSNKNEWVKIECDQFIYSIGQDSEERSQIFSELKEDVVFDYTPDNHFLGLRTKDDCVHFLGAAGQSVGGKGYSDAMTEWISQNHINDDSAASALLPPSRAMIKLHAVNHGAVLRSVNANIDDLTLVEQLLLDAGSGRDECKAFMDDLIVGRRRTESGMSREKLQKLLVRHKLDSILIIKGHNRLEPVNFM